MPRVFGQDFRDKQSLSRYPFSDASNLSSQTGQVIDHDMFIDASLFPVGNTGALHISLITVSAEEVVIYIANAGESIVASATVDLLNPPSNVPVLDNDGLPAGVLVSEPTRLANFTSWTQGQHTFPIGNAEFLASCTIPMPATGVRGIQTDDGDTLSGDVWLIGRDGVVFRPDPDDAAVIRMDIVGDPLFRRRLCSPLDLFTTPRLVKTINGCPPDEYGDFQLAVGDHIAENTIVRIYPDGNGGLVIAAVGDTNV